MYGEITIPVAMFTASPSQLEPMFFMSAIFSRYFTKDEIPFWEMQAGHLRCGGHPAFRTPRSSSLQGKPRLVPGLAWGEHPGKRHSARTLPNVSPELEQLAPVIWHCGQSAGRGDRLRRGRGLPNPSMDRVCSNRAA